MLPNHSPLKVMENFTLLEGLYPGRVDLGIGRASGADGRTMWALLRSRELMEVNDFPEQLDILLSFLTVTLKIPTRLVTSILLEINQWFQICLCWDLARADYILPWKKD